MKYKELSLLQKPDHALVITNAQRLPDALDYDRFNLVVANYRMSEEAQTYFDSLDLVKVAATAPDRQEITKPKVCLFKLSSIETAGDIIRRNLPGGVHQEDFVTAQIDIMGLQQKLLGLGTSFEAIINLPGSHGIVHYDNKTSWRSLWQPCHSVNAADTTIIADNAVRVRQDEIGSERINNFGKPEVQSGLFYSVPPGAILFWTGEYLQPALLHAEPDIPENFGGQPRFTLLAQNKL